MQDTSAIEIRKWNFDNIIAGDQILEEIITLRISLHSDRIPARIQYLAAIAMEQIDPNELDTQFAAVMLAVIIRILPDAIPQRHARHEAEINGQVAVVIIYAAMTVVA